MTTEAESRPGGGVAWSIAGLLAGVVLIHLGATRSFGITTAYARETIIFTSEGSTYCPTAQRGASVELWPAAESGGVERVRLARRRQCFAVRKQFSATPRPVSDNQRREVLRWAFDPESPGDRLQHINVRWEPDWEAPNVIRALDTPSEIEISLGTVRSKEGEDWIEVKLTSGEIGYMKKNRVELGGIEIN